MPEIAKEIEVPKRILLGPGPSNVHPRVLKAMSMPLIGHLDPEFLKIMDQTMELLRTVFQTKNRLTIPVSGTGSAGMEAAFVNFIEEGDKVIVAINGVFGERVADLLRRLKAQITEVRAEWGRPIDVSRIEEELKKDRFKAVTIVHAETSTGVLQPIEGLGKLAKENGALFIVDTVTSLGGVPVKVDEWMIDVSYSGTQKCLSCPPGISPFTVNERAIEVMKGRKTKIPSWYFDLTMIEKYWGSERVYHHTAPISMIYALREALRLIIEEGLEARFKRHFENYKFLSEKLGEIGINYLVEEKYRLPSLNSVLIPAGVNDKDVRKRLLDQYDIEIGGGLGVLGGKIWRIGLMGYSSNKDNINLLVNALKDILKK